MEQNLANSKADKKLGALAQQSAAKALIVEGSYGFSDSITAVTTGDIPNPTTAAGVVTNFVPFTPKFSGNLKVTTGYVTSPNANVAAQAVRPSFGISATLPTIGTTTIAGGNATADNTAAPGASASGTAFAYIPGRAIGTEIWVCTLLAQSAAGAFSFPAGPPSGTWMIVEEVP